MQDLKFTKTHEWIKQTSPDLITVGITDHAQQLLGDLVFVELPQIGITVNAGDELGVLESVKAAADFYAPISGTITEINQNICDAPSLINQDPYNQGWLIKIQATDPSEINDLLDNNQYSAQIIEEHA